MSVNTLQQRVCVQNFWLQAGESNVVGKQLHDFGVALLGAHIQTYWPDEGKWWKADVVGYDDASGEHGWVLTSLPFQHKLPCVPCVLTALAEPAHVLGEPHI